MITAGDVIGGRLRIDHILGEGGMGVVAAATHLELGHRVAVKVMRDELATSPTIVERFIREARAVVNLRTEHVCRVLDVGRQPSGAPYIVMEMLEGADLARAIAQRPLPVMTAVEYVMQACVALAEAHDAGIVHRDLKPANLFVTRRPDGGPRVKVLDFGIAKAIDSDAHLTRTTGAMGSPGYMSPEQIQSARDVDPRTDIWALGVTLYQLISGRLPFYSPTITEIAIKIATEPPAPLDVDPALGAVIWRCLDKDRARRYPDVVSLGADLARFAGPPGRTLAAEIAQMARKTVPVPAAAPVVAAGAPTAASYVGTAAHTPAPITGAPAAKRSRAWIAIVALVLAGGVAAAAFALSGSAPPAPARDAAAVARTAATADATVEPDAATSPHRDPWEVEDDSPSLPPELRREPAAPHPAPAKHVNPASQAAISEEIRRGMQQSCAQATDPAFSDRMPPLVVAMCWCVRNDRARAQAAYGKLQNDTDRAKVTRQCELVGVTVP